MAVTGASGFVGRHVLAALSGRPGLETVAVSRRPIPDEQLPAGASWLALDTSAAPSGAYARMGSPDLVIHLAWEGLPNYQSSRHVDVELPHQTAFLTGLVEAGLPSLLVAGTCYEYGRLEGELVEGMAGELTTEYARAKVALHQRLCALNERTAFALTWTRLFYLWGEGQAPGSLYSLLKAAVERGDRRFPMSKGDQLRDYLEAEAAAAILVELALRRQDMGLVNVCSGRPIAIRSLVEAWLQENGWQIELEPGVFPYPEYEPFAFWGSRQKLDSVLEGG